MKKIYLLACVTLLSLSIQAQDVSYVSKTTFDKRELSKPIGNSIKKSTTKKSVANRTTIWSDDFSVPSNWP